MDLLGALGAVRERSKESEPTAAEDAKEKTSEAGEDAGFDKTFKTVSSDTEGDPAAELKQPSEAATLRARDEGPSWGDIEDLSLEELIAKKEAEGESTLPVALAVTDAVISFTLPQSPDEAAEDMLQTVALKTNKGVITTEFRGGKEIKLDLLRAPVLSDQQQMLTFEKSVSAQSTDLFKVTDAQLSALSHKHDMPSPAPTSAAADAAKQVLAAIRAERGASGGIEVRLDPPDLGRVRIHFAMDRSDTVLATVSADRAETLDVLRRHAGDLIKELQQAGFAHVALDFAQKGDDHAEDDAAAGSADAGDSDADALSETTIMYVARRSDNLLDRLV